MMLASQILWRLHHPFLLSHGKSHSFSFAVLLGIGTSTIGGQRWQSSLIAVKGKVTAGVVFEEFGSE